MDKFKLIQLLNKVELAVGETVMSKKVKENINELILDVKNEAINYTPCCTELPMIEELIISEIRRKHQKQVDDEVERFLNGNGTDCRLRGFFSEQDLKE